jgi:hypothetical protein
MAQCTIVALPQDPLEVCAELRCQGRRCALPARRDRRLFRSTVYERYARACGLKVLIGIYLILLHFVECDIVRPHSRDKSEVEVLRWYMVFYALIYIEIGSALYDRSVCTRYHALSSIE